MIWIILAVVVVVAIPVSVELLLLWDDRDVEARIQKQRGSK